MHDGGHFFGMHWFWWTAWIILMVWIFILPHDIPGQRRKKESPMSILKKRYAAGDITKEEYQEKKKVLEQ